MPGLRKGFAGEVAISAEIAARNARRLGHTVGAEIKILTLHAVLHLAGYDHEHDKGEMEREEKRLRKALGLPVGLIERSGRSSKAKSAKRKSKQGSMPGRSRVLAPKRSGTGSSSRIKRASR
jgi:probable rRNA maturation factor